MEVDGSLLEGGGQILRVSAALSQIMGTPITVMNIRAQRKRPGLKRQHLCGLQLVAEMGNGTLDGAAIDATTVALVPGSVRPRPPLPRTVPGRGSRPLAGAWWHVHWRGGGRRLGPPAQLDAALEAHGSAQGAPR